MEKQFAEMQIDVIKSMQSCSVAVDIKYVSLVDFTAEENL